MKKENQKTSNNFSNDNQDLVILMQNLTKTSNSIEDIIEFLGESMIFNLSLGCGSHDIHDYEFLIALKHLIITSFANMHDEDKLIQEIPQIIENFDRAHIAEGKGINYLDFSDYFIELITIYSIEKGDNEEVDEMGLIRYVCKIFEILPSYKGVHSIII